MDRSALVTRALSTLSALVWLAMTWPMLALLAHRLHRPAVYALVATLAVAAGLPAVGRAFERAVLAPPRAVFIGLVALAQAGLTELSLRWIARGHTLSPDGAVYWFQARAMSHGSFGTPLELPRQAFSLRFLFEGADGALHGVFPPGWPLFLVPFVRVGRPFAAGIVVAMLLAWSIYALARRLAEGDRFSDDDDTHNQRTRELVARTAALLAVPSFARALETTDLLSHAFVAALGAFACALALSLSALSHDDGRAAEKRWALRVAAIAALVAWAFAARLLDGLVIALFVAALGAKALWAVWRAGARRVVWASLVAAMIAALPFVLLVAAHQKSATGSWTTPTQRAYFARSDWPPTCHRLGFGPDVGCEVEHGDDRAAMGPEGYTPRRAWAVARSRALVFGDDLLSPGHLLALALFLSALRPSWRATFAALFVVALTLAYGLFYYGNAPLFGARHLFPAAPFVFYLVARMGALPSSRWPKLAPHGAFALALFTACAAGQGVRWLLVPTMEPELRERLPWIRPVIERAANPQGIILASDLFHAITGFDPWLDRGARVVAVSDDAGSRELRRAHPSWPVFVPNARNTLELLRLGPVRDDLSVELESMWPAFQWPSGLKASRYESRRLAPTLIASGGRVLLVEHARPGSRLRVTFDVAGEARGPVAILGIRGPDFGDYSVALDGRPLLTIRGYAPSLSTMITESQPTPVSRGTHELVFECVGRDERSRGYGAALDAFVARRGP